MSEPPQLAFPFQRDLGVEVMLCCDKRSSSTENVLHFVPKMQNQLLLWLNKDWMALEHHTFTPLKDMPN